MEIERLFYNISDYTFLGQKLGQGSFGEVYLVQNKNDEKLFAAKIIKSDNNFDGDKQKTFLSEALIMHKLNHCSIVKFQGINFKAISNNQSHLLEPSILTEYLPKGSLRDIIHNKSTHSSNTDLTPTKRYIILLGTADAMRYLHEHGIVHRDLKSENILIDENCYPKVCDFGVSRCFPHILTETMQLTMTSCAGSPAYMAPELIEENDNHFTPKIDVYSFGILAYEIVTGKVPYKDIKISSSFNFFQKVLRGARPKFEDGTPQKMIDLISGCWNKDPLLRPSFKEIFNKLSSDFSYFNEEINEVEVKEFIKILEEERKKEEIEKENKQNLLANEDENKKKIGMQRPNSISDKIKLYNGFSQDLPASPNRERPKQSKVVSKSEKSVQVEPVEKPNKKTIFDIRSIIIGLQVLVIVFLLI